VLLAGLGFEVAASTGRPEQAAYLHELGATEIVDRASMATAGKPLQSERWAGVVDTVGSHTLANACAATRWNGAVAACGLAQGADLPATVLPFILRGVTLYGINCVITPNATRTQAWALLARHLSPDTLARMTSEIGLSEAIRASTDLLDGRLHGRTVVAVDR
jgi:acrylyl-CoA reductase (NADPH)